MRSTSRIYPVLRYLDAKAAIDWLERALGFERREVHEGEDGAVVHAELTCDDSVLMLSTEPPGGDERWGKHAKHAGRAWIYVVIDDPDAHFERARAAGAEIVMDLTDTDYGSRDYSARDPEGNLWSFGTYRPAAS